MNVGKAAQKSQPKLTNFFTTANARASGGDKQNKRQNMSPTNMLQTNANVSPLLTETPRSAPNQQEYEHERDHDHESEHENEHEHEHNHEHDHESEHENEQEHEHERDHDHESEHENEHEHDHNHEHDHESEQDPEPVPAREQDHEHEQDHNNEYEHEHEEHEVERQHGHDHPHQHHHTPPQAVDVQANTVTRRRSALVRPPKFSNRPQSLEGFSSRLQTKHEKTLKQFRVCKASQRWSRLHQSHFDWWMFPIDDGSRPLFNVTSEAHINILSSNHVWMQDYLEGVKIMAEAWGWDLRKRRWITHCVQGQGWSDWDVRLAKVCRSLWLFNRVSELESMQQYARDVQKRHKNGKSFTYGRFTLDELLHFKFETNRQSIAEN